MATEERYSRNVALFGARGQELITSLHVAVVGLGGIGSHLVQQLAYLGVTGFTLVDHDVVSESNLNRLIGAREPDIGVPKIDVARRTIESIQPTADVSTHPMRVGEVVAMDGLSMADVAIGAVDADPVRLELLSAAARAAKPYVDCASDVLVEDGSVQAYGGHVVFNFVEGGCLSCFAMLDQRELRRARMTPEELAADDAIYGVPRSALNERGPSVVSINGVVASLAVTELMVWRVGLRAPRRILRYVADDGGVRPSRDIPPSGCYYCSAYTAGNPS